LIPFTGLRHSADSGPTSHLSTTSSQHIQQVHLMMNIVLEFCLTSQYFWTNI